MKHLIYTTALLILFASCSEDKKQAEEKEQPAEAVAAKPVESVVIQPQYETDSLKGSLKAQASGTIGGAEMMISYHSPAVRGRIVWGGLVPYDNVWVTGAHMATSLETNADITINGQTLPAGKYALFTIPGKEKWTVIINKKWEQHLTDEYDAKDDLIRMEVTPGVAEISQERLMYAVEAVSEKNGQINFHWEKVLITIPFSVI